MKRASLLMENISKLNTFSMMLKSNEILSSYIQKIANRKCKAINYVADFDIVSLDLLFTSLKLMNQKEDINDNNFKKIDQKEFKFYLNKLNISSSLFKNKFNIKNEVKLIKYIRDSLITGDYVCNSEASVRFNNGLVLNSEWLVGFADFLINSFNNVDLINNMRTEYFFKVLEIPKYENNKQFLKDLKVYEYKVSKKDKRKLTYQNILYLNNELDAVNDYDFNELKAINSKLSKDNFSLSITKKAVILTREEKDVVTNMLNENSRVTEVLVEYIKERLGCIDTKTNKNRKRLIVNYELLRSLAHAYKAEYSLDKCRNLFDISFNKQEVLACLSVADFYINYVYDENSLVNSFSYDLLELNKMKPKIIDYETSDYKSIISELSLLNRKVVAENKKINTIIDSNRKLSKVEKEKRKENGRLLEESCSTLQKLVSNIKILRENLSFQKEVNLQLFNVNKTKIRYLKESFVNGSYYYDVNNRKLVFKLFNKKDYHLVFDLELTVNDFVDILLSDYNKNLRINYYFES